MKIHPYLQDPCAILVTQRTLTGPVSWEDYREAAFHTMIAAGVELAGERAVFKPNATSGERFADADTGITTHPAFIQGLVEYIQEHGARRAGTWIVEDPRNSDDNSRRTWQGTGFERVSHETGARLNSTTTTNCVRKTVPNPLAHETLSVSRLATANDSVLINVPKLKNHNLGITTLCMKNLMGLVNVKERHYCIQAWNELPEEVSSNNRPRHEWLNQTTHERWQAGLARRLIDTAQVIRPDLNIVEGIVGREGTGFQRGRNRTLGLAITGINMVAVDSLASFLMGFDPLRLVYLKMAAEAGLGENDPKKLIVYLEKEGDLIQCESIETLRVDPPFHVITNTVDEGLVPFEAAAPGSKDVSDILFGRAKS